MRFNSFVPLTLALIIITGHAAGAADDWGQWRGPTRDGWVRAKDVPADWPEKLTKKWTAPAGEGYSSPVVSGSLVFVHSRQDPEEVVTAFDLANGRGALDRSLCGAVREESVCGQHGEGAELDAGGC